MNSPIGWVGGKRLLAKKIVSLFPKHNLYCEVFGGGASVLLAKSSDFSCAGVPHYCEIFNDINGELITLLSLNMTKK
jgi:DNA adenine methylase